MGDGSSFQPEHWQTALTKARVNEGQRSLRIKVTNLTIEVLTSHVVLNFSLGRGAYATAVLRELCTW